MAVRNAQHLSRSTSPFAGAGAIGGEARGHRTVLTRRAHRAAHAEAARERRRWAIVGTAALALPFAAAMLIVELLH